MLSSALLASATRSPNLATKGYRPQPRRRASHCLDVSQLDFAHSPAMTHSRSYAPMPGSFTSHPQHKSGPKSNVFRPPLTPQPSTSSSSYLTRSTMSLCEDSDRSTATISRKRTRYEFTSTSVTPVSNIGDWSTELVSGDTMAGSGSIDPISPMPFVSTRYQLRGGLDTPGAAASNSQEAAESEYYDKGFRKDLGGYSRPEETDSNLSFFPPIESPSSSGNGEPQAQKREGWSKAAIGVVGGVVGKVWEFCNAPFRGFVAGGGTAYNSSARPITPNQDFFWRDDLTSHGANDRISTPIPGQFPDDDFISDYMDNPTPNSHIDNTQQRPSKRRQISNPRISGDLEKSWVMVSEDSLPTTRLDKPKPQSRFSMPTSASSQRRPGTPASRASNAGVRRTIISRSSTTGVSHAGSPSLHARGASFASPRSPGGSKIPIPSYPLSPSKTGRTGMGLSGSGAESPAAKEAKRWAAKKKMEERENDEAIRKFNKQLRDMIREGKEALGTRISVHNDDEDEGFEDGT